MNLFYLHFYIPCPVLQLFIAFIKPQAPDEFYLSKMFSAFFVALIPHQLQIHVKWTIL
jgi:hypothetical protein